MASLSHTKGRIELLDPNEVVPEAVRLRLAQHGIVELVFGADDDALRASYEDFDHLVDHPVLAAAEDATSTFIDRASRVAR